MKRPKSLGEPIASRELVREGSDQPIHVFIWKPFKEDDEVWACPYQIKGFGDEAVHHSYGSDAMQALQLSFDALRADLNPKENKIHWVAPDIGDAGFPRTVTYVLGADVYEYLCALMDREITPFGDNPRKSSKARKATKAQMERWKKEAGAAQTSPRKRRGKPR